MQEIDAISRTKRSSYRHFLKHRCYAHQFDEREKQLKWFLNLGLYIDTDTKFIRNRNWFY